MRDNAPPPWAHLPAAGPLLRPASAAEYMDLSPSGYYRLVAAGLLPRPLKIGLQATGVPRSWLDAVVADRAEREALA